MLAGDVMAISRRFAHRPRLAATLASLLGDLHRAILADELLPREVSLVLIGDCVMSEVVAFLTPALAARGIRCRTEYLYFSSGVARELSLVAVDQALSGRTFDLVALSPLTFEGLPRYRDLLREAARDHGFLPRVDHQNSPGR